jgi:hypothetical protein
MLLDVSFNRQKVLLDECGSVGVLVRLDIQPSTGASRWRSAEVEQDHPLLLFGCR